MGYILFIILILLLLKGSMLLADWFFWTDDAKIDETITNIAEKIGGKSDG